MKARRLLAFLALAALLDGLAAADEVPKWMAGLEAGSAQIHRSSSRGGAGGIRLFRDTGRGLFRLDAGALISGADDGFATFDFGAELHPWTRWSVAPYLGAGVGLLVEPEFAGTVLRAQVGVEARLGTAAVLRLGIQRGTHGGEMGPHLLTLGLGFRFGRPRASVLHHATP